MASKLKVVLHKSSNATGCHICPQLMIYWCSLHQRLLTVIARDRGTTSSLWEILTWTPVGGQRLAVAVAEVCDKIK